jgi:hypothetical protein
MALPHLSHALLPIITRAINGFNKNKPPTHAAVFFLDLFKAFNAVDHTLLLERTSASPLHSNLVLWLAAWFHGHQATCNFRVVNSKKMLIRSGTQQGVFLSPELHNFYVNDFPDKASLTPADFSQSELSPSTPTLTKALNEDLTHVDKWWKDKKIINQASSYLL